MQDRDLNIFVIMRDSIMLFLNTVIEIAELDHGGRRHQRLKLRYESASQLKLVRVALIYFSTIYFNLSAMYTSFQREGERNFT